MSKPATDRTAHRSPRQDESLVQGGPGDQAGLSADSRDTGQAGSQQGRPQQQEPATGQRTADGGSPPPNGQSANHDERAITDMERKAGTPDDRATTDWAHGEGEPKTTPPSTDKPRR
ncbi:MAG: hypothetical protein H0W40_08270 [Methylibium sp.]|uniref:hypothetical protein n=1 Tax=Methylibium sp. TaxID=2067992 RepID=UPI001837811A|nr:hypothetical protein [Methylibium sp.]MBA3597358.1 hypothetical protein [Methylibium sp.]